jgi:hypothetical protein
MNKITEILTVPYLSTASVKVEYNEEDKHYTAFVTPPSPAPIPTTVRAKNKNHAIAEAKALLSSGANALSLTMPNVGVIGIDYTSWTGRRAVLRIIPHSFWFGCTDVYPENQWLMRAFETDKHIWRNYALKNIHGYVPISSNSSAKP